MMAPKHLSLFIRRAALGLGLLCAAGSGLGCGSESEAVTEEAGPAAARIAPVRLWTATAREVVDRAELPADLRPYRRGVLASEVAGVVEALRVDAGDRVATGQVLAEVDTRSLEQRLAEAEAVERHRRARYERAVKLLDRRSITAQQAGDALAEKEVAEAQAASARLALEKSKLGAPWPGTVAVRRVEVGDYVSPGQPLFELLDLRRIKAVASAAAADVPYLHPGLPAEVRLDVFPGEVFAGTVRRLGAELDPATRTLEVEVELDNADGRLVPGMDAELVLPRRVLPAAVLVPLAALVEQETSKAVYVVDGPPGEERAERREVVLGPVLEDQVVIESGLAAGEAVILEGQRLVSSGQRVRPVETEG